MARWLSEALGALLKNGPIVVPGLYAWLTTVLVPVVGPARSLTARVSGALALLALLVGPALLPSRPRLARAIGIYVFLALSVVTWLELGDAIGVERIEPVRAALGSVGFGAFAFGWGRLRDRRHIPEDDPRVIAGPPLPVRLTLPPGAPVVLAGAVLLALVPVFLAWRVDRPTHALLAHAAALLAALGLVAAGSRIATERSAQRRTVEPQERLRRASSTLIILSVLCASGLVFGFLL